jgi:transcriptional regulator with XRE-family HTH domain
MPPVTLHPEVHAVHVGERIRQHRQQKKLGLKTVADRLSRRWPTLDHSWLSKIERGKVALSFDQFLLICWALSADPGELAKGLTPPD